MHKEADGDGDAINAWKRGWQRRAAPHPARSWSRTQQDQRPASPDPPRLARACPYCLDPLALLPPCTAPPGAWPAARPWGTRAARAPQGSPAAAGEQRPAAAHAAIAGLPAERGEKGSTGLRVSSPERGGVDGKQRRGWGTRLPQGPVEGQDGVLRRRTILRAPDDSNRACLPVPGARLSSAGQWRTSNALHRGQGGSRTRSPAATTARAHLLPGTPRPRGGGTAHRRWRRPALGRCSTRAPPAAPPQRRGRQRGGACCRPARRAGGPPVRAGTCLREAATPSSQEAAGAMPHDEMPQDGVAIGMNNCGTPARVPRRQLPCSSLAIPYSRVMIGRGGARQQGPVQQTAAKTPCQGNVPPPCQSPRGAAPHPSSPPRPAPPRTWPGVRLQRAVLQVLHMPLHHHGPDACQEGLLSGRQQVLRRR